MKKIFLLIILIIILLPSNAVKPSVNADDFIFEPDSLVVASLFSFIDEESNTPLPPTPKEVCQCTKGKVSYDGGTSLTDCPCILSGGPCDCPSCPNNKANQEVGSSNIYEDEEFIKSLMSKYHITKATASWCVPCEQWERSKYPAFKEYGIELKKVDIDSVSGKNLLQVAGIDTIPHFLICTSVDNIYHRKNNDEFLGYNGPNFTKDQAVEMIIELDKKLHPNRINGVFYERKQKLETSLNGKMWASSSEYINHLRNHSNHKDKVTNWPLEKLSQYELKAIHDDDHANKLGDLNEL